MIATLHLFTLSTGILGWILVIAILALFAGILAVLTKGLRLS